MSPASMPQGWVLGRIGGAPVVVAPTSLLLGLIIAGSWFPLVSSLLSGFGTLTVLGVVVGTVAGVAVSVTLHELAHGMVGTLLGRRPIHYELHLWGGRTTFGPSPTWRPWKDVLTSLAGPLTNLALWQAGRWLLGSASTVLASEPVLIAVWALTWVNLALAVFNALPGLPLDGGHALASLVHQLTGRRRLGDRVAAVGGLVILAWIAWRWVVSPLVLHGQRPGSFSLILAIMVCWPIATTSWRILGLGRSNRAAARLDLRALARPVAVVPSTEGLAQVRSLLAGQVALVLVVDGASPAGAIDAVGLTALDLPEDAAVTAGQVSTVLPAAAMTTELAGPGAAEALRRARAVSRWLVIVQEGRILAAVPTGAR